MTAQDLSYYRARAIQEDEAASSARCDASRDRHREMAAMYRLRCMLGLKGDMAPHLTIVPPSRVPLAAESVTA